MINQTLPPLQPNTGFKPPRKNTPLEYDTIKKLVQDWIKKNPLADGARYSKLQLLELDRIICGYAVDSKMSDDKVYYSIHTVNWLLDLLGAQVQYTYEIVDYNKYQTYKTESPDKNDIVTLRKNPIEIQGYSISIKFESNILPIQQNIVSLQVMDKKSAINLKPTAADIEYYIDRAKVKAIGQETGLGYSCWLDSDFVVEQVKNVNTDLYNKLISYQQPAQYQQRQGQTQASNGMVSNVQSIQPPLPKAPLAPQPPVQPQVQQPIQTPQVPVAPVTPVAPVVPQVPVAQPPVQPVQPVQAPKVELVPPVGVPPVGVQPQVAPTPAPVVDYKAKVMALINESAQNKEVVIKYFKEISGELNSVTEEVYNEVVKRCELNKGGN